MRSRLLTGTFLLLLAACGGSAPDAATPGRADAGDPVAQYHLALRHFTGSGAQKDLARAAELYLASAEQGFSPAQVNLGAMYYAGIGVPRDRVESAKWFALAADQDLAEGQTNLGVQLLSGDGAEKDLARAAELFRKAGLQGHEQAQENLGLMHLNGDGVEKDTIDAYAWLRVAAASGSPSATTPARSKTSSRPRTWSAVSNGRARSRRRSVREGRGIRRTLRKTELPSRRRCPPR